MSSTDVSKVRADLEHQRAEILERLSGLTSDGSAAPDFDEGFADSAQVAAEQGENASLAASLREQLADAETAMARIDDGTYGVCEVCGEAISEDRLEAMPAASRCIKHA
ncbi:MAG: regulatory protein DksA/TraR family [Acidimicrobiales bacterium]|nr:regulatory protein DksA/TraR family [Acidimicrobiales bacterium]